MAALIRFNGNTHYAEFSIDGASELSKLPTSVEGGKQELILIRPVTQGSIAIGTDGNNYILTGNNTWISYAGSGGGGGTLVYTDTDDVDAMF